jgi:hypothetical protein
MTSVETPFQETAPDDVAIGDQPGDVYVVVGDWDEARKRELGAGYVDCLIYGIYASRAAADKAALRANYYETDAVTWEVTQVLAVNVHLELGKT